MNEVRNERNELNDPSGYTLMSYSVSSDGLKNHIKSPILWGNFMKDDYSAVSMPLAYLRRLKWISDENWDKVISGVKLNIPHESRSFTV